MKLDKRLLTVYASNFAFFAGVGAFLPFHVLYLKQSGITASELGVMLGITPLLAILSCMLLSAIADKYSALKLVTQIAIGGSALCFSLFIAVPVDQKIANAGSSLVNFTLNQSFELVQSSNSSSPIFEPVKNLSDGDAPIPALSFEVSGSLQFWLFFMLRLVGVLFFQPAFTLQTSLQLSVMRGNTEKFSRGRAIGSFGCLVGALVQSLLNQFVPPPGFLAHAVGVNILASVVLFDILSLVSAVLIQYFDLPPASPKAGDAKAKVKASLWKSLRQAPMWTMLVVITMTGMLFGVLESYSYYYAEDMKPVKMFWAAFVGVAIASEVLVMWFSGNIVRKLGEPNCLILVLLTYSIRFGVNGLLREPWPLLGTQLLNGITFGLHFVSFASYVGRHAPSDCVASLQGVATAAHFGLGISIGGFIGGFLWARLGGSKLFFVCSAFALFVAVTYAICHHAIIKRCFPAHLATPVDSVEHSELTTQSKIIKDENSDPDDPENGHLVLAKLNGNEDDFLMQQSEDAPDIV